MTTKPKPSIDDPFLTLTEAAKQLGRHQTTIREWISSGALEATQSPSGLYRVLQSTVNAWKLPPDAKDRVVPLLKQAKLNAAKSNFSEDVCKAIDQVIAFAENS